MSLWLKITGVIMIISAILVLMIQVIDVYSGASVDWPLTIFFIVILIVGVYFIKSALE